MSQQIWEFELQSDDYIYGGAPIWLSMPEGARIIAAAPQNGDVYLWAIVDTTRPIASRQFVCYGTGHAIDDPNILTHIATFQSGSLVFHVFEVRP